MTSRAHTLWRGMVMKPGKHQRSNKDGKINVGRSMTVHKISLFCVHTLRMSYAIKTFLFVSSSVSSKQLFCFVQCQGQKRGQTHTTKNFVEFHNHSPLLTMLQLALDRNKRIFTFKCLQSAVCGLHSTLGRHFTPGTTYGVCSLRF